MAILTQFIDNPITQRMVRDARWPQTSLANVLVIIGCMLLGILVGLVEGALLRPGFLSAGGLDAFRALLSPLRMGLYLGPAFLALVAWTVSSRDVGSDAFQIMRLTQVTQHDIVRGYAAVSVFRFRLVLAFAVGALIGSVSWFILQSVLDIAASAPALLWLMLTLPAVLLRFVIFSRMALALGTLSGVRARGVVVAVTSIMGAFLLLALLETVLIGFHTYGYAWASIGGSIPIDFKIDYLRNVVLSDVFISLFAFALSVNWLGKARKHIPLPRD